MPAVQSRDFSEMLKKTLNAYHNRAIDTQEVIEELIKLAKEMSAATQRGVDLGLTDDEKSRSMMRSRRMTAP